MISTRKHLAYLMLCLTAGMLAACGQVITRPTSAPMPTPAPARPIFARPLQPTPTADTYRPPPSATATATPEPILYRVVPGDTLDLIAARYDVPKTVLREVNGIENELALQVDQVLIIPVAGWGGTAEPTPTVTATPMPVAIENVYFQPSPLGELAVLGEVRNLSATDLERVVVQITLFDAADRPLGSQKATMAVDALAPAERAPIVLVFAEAPQHVASYQATVLSAEPAYVGSLQRQLEPQNVTLEQVGAGMVRLTGRIRNVGAEEAVEVYVVVTLYDPLGRVVGARREPAEPDTVAKGGGEADFSVEIVPAGSVATYAVQSQGRKPAKPPS